MRHRPEDENDLKELADLNAAPWMVEALRMNPDYTCWGPHEDSMFRRNPDEGPDEFGRVGKSSWSCRFLQNGWREHDLDDFNEIVHFYFQVDRESKPCVTCVQTGYHPDAQWVTESFCAHSSPFKRRTEQQERAKMLLASFGSRLPTAPLLEENSFPSAEVLSRYGPEFLEFCSTMRSSLFGEWSRSITQDEVDALVEAGRLRDFTHRWEEGKWISKESPVTAEQVNADQDAGPGKRVGFGHDAINRCILIEARLKRYGIPKSCPTCDGESFLYTAPAAHLNLILWVLHPRKGAARGVEYSHIQESDMPDILKTLREAARRNADRFRRIGATP